MRSRAGAGASTLRPPQELASEGERPAQLLGERAEDVHRGQRAGDVLRTVRRGRRGGRAVTDLDVVVDLHDRRGLQLGVVVEGGVVAGYCAGVADPPALVDEA